jgi:GalNAc5-diNAcBac-PP-undecaprenol beta-1,3-glucosyltransferase
VRATVLIPTHDHGPTLRHSVASALAQTVTDIEIFIVGDGMPDAARDVARSVARLDPRIRLFENPKGPRHGEILRHEALREAVGHAVCYLSDDDLWMPNHVETMLALLEHCDFANAVPLYLDLVKGLQGMITVNLENDYFRQLMVSGTNRVPLSCGAHTLQMYRRLPHGWRTTPAGIFTDGYMWQQFLADPACRAASAARPTVLCFPSTMRTTATIAERVDELAYWRGRIEDPVLTAWALEWLVREAARNEAYRLDLANRSVEMRAGKKLLSLPVIGALARMAYRLRDRASSR